MFNIPVVESIFLCVLLGRCSVTGYTFILCECEALAHLRFRHLGRYFMEPSAYFDVPTYKILHYIRSAGLLRG
jgi:hypothetical protein